MDIPIQYWFLLVEFWIIVGIVFIFLETIDGSLIFFLPIGIGSLFNALLLFIQNDYPFLSLWHQSLVSVAIFSLIISFAIRFFHARDNEDDINKY